VRQSVEWETGRMQTTDGQGDAQDDAALLARVAASDRDALAGLYHRHGTALLRYLLQLTPDHALAEDILQDTLLAVWKSAGSYGSRASVRTWLFGIARRQAHNHLRRRGVAWEPVDALYDMPAPDPEPEDAMLANVEREALIEAIRDLVPAHREVLVLVLVDDLSYQEAADVLGVPVGTVKSRLNHARGAVRARLAQRKERER
jgi:RNA polymerase sigma-70 factor, ECF subfamily